MGHHEFGNRDRVLTRGGKGDVPNNLQCCLSTARIADEVSLGAFDMTLFRVPAEGAGECFCPRDRRNRRSADRTFRGTVVDRNTETIPYFSVYFNS